MLKIAVAVKFYKGEISPFDASALEWALSEKNAEVTVISMSPITMTPQAEYITRLGADFILVSDKALIGSDTLVTSKVLAETIKRISPDIVYCGRQSVDGDTAQVPAEISELIGYDFIPYAMEKTENTVKTRYGEREITGKTVISWEKTKTLRAASIRSKKREVKVIGIKELGLKETETGFIGSPTKVIKTFESERGKRRCKFIDKSRLYEEIENAKNKKTTTEEIKKGGKKLKRAVIVGEGLNVFGEEISEEIVRIPAENKTPSEIAEKIKELKIKNVFFKSDPFNRVLAPKVAAILNAGLCADCVNAETDGEKTFVYRPAAEGKIIAKIESESEYFLATVRENGNKSDDIVIGVGYGAKDSLKKIEEAAKKLNAAIAGTRKAVDCGILPYESQVGLTGKTINPKVYIAIGISGAIQHITGIEQSETVIAINCDKNAEIFEYADIGVKEKIEDVEL